MKSESSREIFFPFPKTLSLSHSFPHAKRDLWLGFTPLSLFLTRRISSSGGGRLKRSLIGISSHPSLTISFLINILLRNRTMAVAFPQGRAIHSLAWYLEDIQLNTNWEDVTCPICLDFPHNGVLLQCSSYDKGCRPFMCDTDQTHSNCLNRFKNAYKMTTAPKEPSTTNWSFVEAFQVIPSSLSNLPTCPLCRGDVTGWVVIVEARMQLDMKQRCCEEKNCLYVGNFLDLKEHARIKHPHSRPSEIDPARQLDWDNFQQSSEIVDVLSTIHAEVPHGVVLGDYVIEYGEADGDDFDDLRQHEGNWWTSCILYKVFGNFRALGSRRRSRRSSTRRGQRQSSSEGSSLDEGSPTSVDVSEYRFDEADEDYVGMDSDRGATPRGIVRRHSWRQRSRFYDT